MKGGMLFPGLLAAWLAACGADAGWTTPPDRKVRLETGAAVEAGKATIDATGGVLAAGATSAVPGLKVTVRPASFPGPTTLSLATRPITGHDAGSDLNPLTPLVVLTSSTPFAQEPLRIEIPVTVPDGHFAAPFQYDAARRRLEPLPVEVAEKGRLVVLVRHLQAPQAPAAASASALAAGKADLSTLGTLELLVSSIREADLQGTYTTGFRPDVDDWQFPNYGSWLEPGGHCAGQMVSAAWYYYERRLAGAPPLFGRFDGGTPDFWKDDVQGYRLASMVQNDMAWDRLERAAQEWVGTMVGDGYTYNALAYGMRLTGHPQFLGVFNKDGGHAILAWRAAKGVVDVVDPNYPGDNKGRVLELANGTFKPYLSGATATAVADGAVAYPTIRHFGMSAFLDWEKVGQRWAELDAARAGAERFPKIGIRLNDQPWTAGVDVEKSPVTLDVDLAAVAGNGMAFRLTMYRRVGATWEATSGSKVLSNADGRLVFSMPLPAGRQTVGFHFMGTTTDAKGKKVEHWAGFEVREVTVKEGSAATGPKPGKESTDKWPIWLACAKEEGFRSDWICTTYKSTMDDPWKDFFSPGYNDRALAQCAGAGYPLLKESFTSAEKAEAECTKRCSDLAAGSTDYTCGSPKVEPVDPCAGASDGDDVCLMASCYHCCTDCGDGYTRNGCENGCRMTGTACGCM